MANLVISHELASSKIALLNNVTVRNGVQGYFNAMLSVNKSTWDANNALVVAFNNMTKEEVVDSEGNTVPRFKTKGQFYDFVGIDDSKGSDIVRGVAFNVKNLWQDYIVLEDGAVEYVTEDGNPVMVSYEDMGFTFSKVVILSRIDEDIPKLLSYIKDIDPTCKGIKYIKTLSDGSLKALIKRWSDDGKPEHVPPMKKAQEQEKAQEITRERILSDILAYMGYTSPDNVYDSKKTDDMMKAVDVLKWLKSQLGITKKF